MPFDGVEPQSIAMSKIDKLVRLREILRTQSDGDQLSWRNCLWRGAFRDRRFRQQPEYVWLQRANAERCLHSESFANFLHVSADDAIKLVGQQRVVYKEGVLDRLIEKELAAGAVPSPKHGPRRSHVFGAALCAVLGFFGG